MRRLALCALAVAALAACKKKAVSPADGAAPAIVVGPVATEEVEPNDRMEQGTRIALGGAVRGRLSSGGGKRGDIDWYRFTSSEARGVLRVEVTGVRGVDLALAAWSLSPRRELARANNARAGAGEILSNAGVGVGEYAIRIRSAGRKPAASDEPYLLTATVRPATEADEVEPNDKRLDAQEMQPARAMQGYFGRRADVDWYKLKLPDTQGDYNLRVEMTAVPGVPGAVLEIQDEIEAPLKKARVAGSTGVLFPNLYVKPRQQVLYLIASAGKGFSVNERYTLQATLQKRTGPAEQEPNDRPPQATPLKAGETMRAYLAPAGDEDWYAIDTPRPSLARIAVTGLDKVDVVLAVLDEAGMPRLSIDEGRAREGEVLPSAPLPAGRSLVRVSAKKRQENVFQAYDLTAELRPDAGDEEHEPNDSTARSSLLVLGSAKKGWIYPRGDVDVYRLDVGGAPGMRRIRFELKGIPKVGLQLVVREASGAMVARAGPQSPEYPLHLEKELLVGTYYLEISGGKLSNPRDPYELRVSGP